MYILKVNMVSFEFRFYCIKALNINQTLHVLFRFDQHCFLFFSSNYIPENHKPINIYRYI